MTARELPAKATPVTPAEVYLAARLALTQQLGHESPRQAAVILTAQLALESKRFASVQNWNLGGIKCGKHWRGCWQFFSTLEHWTPEEHAEHVAKQKPGDTITDVGPSERPGRRVYRVTGRQEANKFRAFESLESAMAHHVAFLASERYAPARALLLDGQAEAFALELGRAGYYTAPPEVYARGVRLLAAEYAKSLPQDPPAPPQNRPEAPALTIAATVAPSEAPEARHEAPARQEPTPAPTAPAPAIVAAPLPRVVDPAPVVARPWWIRLLGWAFRALGRVLARRPLP